MHLSNLQKLNNQLTMSTNNQINIQAFSSNLLIALNSAVSQCNYNIDIISFKACGLLTASRTITKKNAKISNNLI